jgi:hypothetical protein
MNLKAIQRVAGVYQQVQDGNGLVVGNQIESSAAADPKNLLIFTPNSATAAAAGGSLTLTTGNGGATSGDGGALLLNTGTATDGAGGSFISTLGAGVGTNPGGGFTFTAGAGGGAGGEGIPNWGGGMEIALGAGGVYGPGGGFRLYCGAGGTDGSAGGSIIAYAGATTAYNFGADVDVRAGDSARRGGLLQLQAGQGTVGTGNAGAGGHVNIQSGYGATFEQNPGKEGGTIQMFAGGGGVGTYLAYSATAFTARNGTFTGVASYAGGTMIEVTTGAAHQLLAGMTVTLVGVGGTYDGTWTIDTVTGASTFVINTAWSVTDSGTWSAPYTRVNIGAHSILLGTTVNIWNTGGIYDGTFNVVYVPAGGFIDISTPYVSPATGDVTVDSASGNGGVIDLNTGAAGATAGGTGGNGGNFQITCGASAGIGTAGGFRVICGDGGDAGVGGSTEIRAGAGGGTCGSVALYGGDGSGVANEGGAIQLLAGPAGDANDGGTVSITGGQSSDLDDSSAGGAVRISGGEALTGSINLGGPVYLNGGYGRGLDGNGGTVYITGGHSAGDAAGGVVQIVGGNSEGGSTGGRVVIDAGQQLSGEPFNGPIDIGRNVNTQVNLGRTNFPTKVWGNTVLGDNAGTDYLTVTATILGNLTFSRLGHHVLQGEDGGGQTINMTLRSNQPTSGTASGFVMLNSGNTTAAASGVVDLRSGTTTTSGNSGVVTVASGNAAGSSGNVTLTIGTAGGTRGKLVLGDSTTITTIGGSDTNPATVNGTNLTTLTNGSNADALHTHTAVGASQLTVAGLTTTGFTDGYFGYISANSTMTKTDADTPSKTRLFGANEGTAGTMTVAGVVENAAFTTAGGLPAAGASVFLAPGTEEGGAAGKLTATPPSGVGQTVAEVGVCLDNSNYAALKTCKILIQPQPPVTN